MRKLFAQVSILNTDIFTIGDVLYATFHSLNTYADKLNIENITSKQFDQAIRQMFNAKSVCFYNEKEIHIFDYNEERQKFI